MRTSEVTASFSGDFELRTADGLKIFYCEFEGEADFTEDTIEGAYHPDQSAVYGWYCDGWILTKLAVNGLEHPEPNHYGGVFLSLHCDEKEIERFELAVNERAEKAPCE